MYNFTSQLIDIYKEDICVLDYYLKLKSARSISLDTTSSTDIFYNIIVLMQNKSINHSFYVWI